MGKQGKKLVEVVDGQTVLSPAEATLVSRVVNGLTIPQISDRYFRSTHTLHAQMRSVKRKLGCANFANMGMVALKKDVIRLLTLVLLVVQFAYGLSADTDMIRPVRAKARVARVLRLRKREDA